MADTNTTEKQAVPAAEKPASLSAEAAYSAAASAEPVTIKPAASEKTAATPASKPAAPKPAATKAALKKTVTKRKAATSKKTVKKGTTKMTTATKRVVKNTKAANTKAANKAKSAAETFGSRFEKLTATAQERAKEAADRAVEASKNAVEFNRENIETLIESGKITAKGAQEIGKTNMKYTRENFVEASRALQGVFSVATPKDFIEKQTDYLRSGVDRVMDQTSSNVEAVTKLAGQAYQPIADRFSTIRKEMKKAA